MKQLTCEMCGSTELLKQDGVFVCQNCGTKYSVEEAKKMMIEGTVNVQGTVKVDNSSNIESFLKLAENAFFATNNKEAESYSNKILEIKPDHYKAWLIKGKAAGWQSTLANNRILESIECFEKAVDNAPESEAADVKKEVAEETSKLSKAILSLCCDRFIEIPNDSNADLLVNNATSIKRLAIILLEKCGVAPAEYEETTAISIRLSAITAYNNIVWPEYSRSNGGHPYDFQFSKFIERGFACIKVLKCSVLMSDKLDEINIKSYKDLIAITTALINAAGYEKQFVGSSSYWAVTRTLSASAKQSNLDDIKVYHQKIKEIDPSYEIPTVQNKPTNTPPYVIIGAILGGLLGLFLGISMSEWMFPTIIGIIAGASIGNFLGVQQNKKTAQHKQGEEGKGNNEKNQQETKESDQQNVEKHYENDQESDKPEKPATQDSTKPNKKSKLSKKKIGIICLSVITVAIVLIVAINSFGNKITSDLVGTWRAERDSSISITFKNNGDMIVRSSNAVDDGLSYKIDGDTVIVTFANNDTETYGFAVEGDTLIFGEYYYTKLK